jgi:hypothetical protein
VVGRQIPHALIALDETLKRIAVQTTAAHVLTFEQLAEGNRFVSGLHRGTPETWHWYRFPPLEGGVPGTDVRGVVPGGSRNQESANE